MPKGGKREGAGRKKAGHTIESEKARALIVDRVVKTIGPLLDSQIALAKGISHLYKIEKKRIVGPKGGVSFQAQKPEIVTEQWEIEAYLEGKFSGDDDPNDPEATYYYITTKEPSNQALDSLMNRAFGKPTESLALSNPDGNPLTIEVALTRTIGRIYGDQSEGD